MRLQSGGRGDRIDHYAFQGALAQLAHQHANQEWLLGGGREREQLAQRAGTLSRRAGSAHGGDVLQSAIDFHQGQGRGGGRGSGARGSYGSVPDAEASLPGVSVQIGHANLNLLRGELAQAGRQLTYFQQPGGGRAYTAGGLDDVGEQSH